jgi:putative transposase
MPGKRFGAEQIIPKVREAEVDLGKGLTVAQSCKKIGVTVQTYYRRRNEYGGIRMDQAKRMKDLEKENARLKRLLADAELDKAILREAALIQLGGFTIRGSLGSTTWAARLPARRARQPSQGQ